MPIFKQITKAVNCICRFLRSNEHGLYPFHLWILLLCMILKDECNSIFFADIWNTHSCKLRWLLFFDSKFLNFDKDISMGTAFLFGSSYVVRSLYCKAHAYVDRKTLEVKTIERFMNIYLFSKIMTTISIFVRSFNSRSHQYFSILLQMFGRGRQLHLLLLLAAVATAIPQPRNVSIHHYWFLFGLKCSVKHWAFTKWKRTKKCLDFFLRFQIISEYSVTSTFQRLYIGGIFTPNSTWNN